jgi:hypothetical protein
MITKNVDDVFDRVEEAKHLVDFTNAEVKALALVYAGGSEDIEL